MIQLRGQPVAMLDEEALAGDQAGARRDRQARAAFIDAELEPERARIAHPLHFHVATVGKRERQRIAFERSRPGCEQTTDQRQQAPVASCTNASAPLSPMPCTNPPSRETF